MDLAQAFLAPQNACHRQYEALRAYFVEQLPGPDALGTRSGVFINWSISSAETPSGSSSRRRRVPA